MTAQEIDRIQNAIRHIQTAVDVDDWAVYIAVEAMQKQIPKKPEFIENKYLNSFKYYCPQCRFYFGTKEKHSIVLLDMSDHCPECGQTIDWEGT